MLSGARLLWTSYIKRLICSNSKNNTSDFCDNHSHPASPVSLYLTSPRPCPTRPCVSHLMSLSLSSHIPKSQVPTHTSRSMSLSPCTQSDFYTQPVQTGPWTHASYSKNGEKTIQCRPVYISVTTSLQCITLFRTFYH